MGVHYSIPSTLYMFEMFYDKKWLGTSLVVQWLRLPLPMQGGLGSIPGQETRSHMLQ